ncbi:hypothetical protein SUGI_0198800 [Cryptomeria japonica]|nr:hypothetical protein SUGI_0198800 [Cryptomeria japonica]
MLQEPRLLYINAESHNYDDVVMVLPEEREAASTWTFVKPFTPRLWCTTAGVMIYTALVVWLLERKINPLLYREMSKMEVFTQICYTSNFTSMLNAQEVNVNELLARDGAMGYLKHHFRQEYLDGSLDINLENLKAYKTVEECVEALSEGPNRGGAAAILMDRTDARHFVSRRPGYTTHDIPPQPEADTPRSFGVKDLLGWFIITGTVSTLGLIKCLFDLWRHRQTDPLELLPPNDEPKEKSSVEVDIRGGSSVHWWNILEEISDWLKDKKLA